MTQAETADSNWKNLYKVAGAAALVALAANVLDTVFSFGETEIIAYGTQTATDWFALYQENGFKGLQVLGLLNIVYMAAMVPVYFAIVTAHRRTHGVYAALAMIVAFIGMAIYIANNAAIPMFVLSQKFAYPNGTAIRFASFTLYKPGAALQLTGSAEADHDHSRN